MSQLAEPYRMSLQAVYKHLRVLEDAGLVSRPRGPQPRPVRLEVQALDLMDTWIERHRARVEQRYRRLDAVLAQMKLAPMKLAPMKLAQMKPAQMKGEEDEQDQGNSHRSGPEAAGHPDGP